MAEEIEKFDPSKLMQGVKDRIKATFVSLIPDEQWDQMVKKEIDAFFDPSTTYAKEVITNSYSSGYGSNNYNTKIMVTGDASVFRAIVFQLCIEKTCDIIKNQLTDTYFKEVYNLENLDEGLKKVIQEAAPLAAVKFMDSMAHMYANQLRNDIQNHRF